MGKKTKKKDIVKEDNNIMENEEKIIDEIPETIEEVAETQEEVEEGIKETFEIGGDQEKTTEEVVENQEEFKPVIEDGIENNEIIGKITGFSKIYVRKEPNKDSEPVGTVSEEDDLSIDMEHSTEEFYKIFSSNGLEGYCVKELIKIE